MTQPPTGTGPNAAIPARLKQVSRAWGLLLLALGILTLGIRGYLLQQLHDGVLTVWQITWLTLPLVVATTILVYRWRARQKTSLAGIIGIVLGTLAASWLTGISSGEHVADALFQVNGDCLLHNTCGTAGAGNPVSLTFRVIGAYFTVYGPAGFLSALVVGAFFGYAFAVLTGQDQPSQPGKP